MVGGLFSSFSERLDKKLDVTRAMKLVNVL